MTTSAYIVDATSWNRRPVSWTNTRSIVRLKLLDAVSQLMNVQRSNRSQGGERRNEEWNGGICGNLEFDGSKYVNDLGNEFGEDVSSINDQGKVMCKKL